MVVRGRHPPFKMGAVALSPRMILSLLLICHWGAASGASQDSLVRSSSSPENPSDNAANEGIFVIKDNELPLDFEFNEPIPPNGTAENSSNSSVNSTKGGLSGEDGPPRRIEYSVAQLDLGYVSNDTFKPRGMEHLYFITNMFMKMIRREEEIPKELSDLIESEATSDGPVAARVGRISDELENNWDAFLLHYIGIGSLGALGLLMALVMPAAGLIFACCRCGGRCGASYPTDDKKRDPCKRACLGTLLATFIVILLLGLVCAFVSNARMETEIHNLPNHLRAGIKDTKLYLNNTHKEVESLCEKNFKQLQKVLFDKLDRSGELINNELARVSKAIAIDNLTAIAISLGDIKKDLRVIRNTTLQLQKETSYLQTGLHDVGTRLVTLRDSCIAIPECLLLINQYATKLEITNEFNKLPNVKTKLAEVSRLIENKIESEVKRGKRAFDSIAREIQSKVQTSIPEIKQQVKETGQQLKKASRDIKKQFQKIRVERANEYIDLSELYINEYSTYRYWSFFGICFMLLLITLCFTMGLAFGCCGRRFDEATSCYKSTGSSWLMWGVGLTFLFSIVIVLSCTILFLVGNLIEIVICDPLRDPPKSEVFTIVANQVDLKQYYPKGEPPQLPQIIRQCHYNESIYNVLHLYAVDSFMDKLSNYRDHLQLDQKVAKLEVDIGKSIDTNVQILSRDAKAHLQELAMSSIADKNAWDYYTDILEQKVLSINLLDLAAQLNQTADELPINFAEIAVKLKNDAIYLEGLRRWLSSIEGNTRKLKSTTERLSELVKFNKTSLRVAIQDLIKQAEFAEGYLQTNGSGQLVQLVNRFTQDFLADVDDYVEHVKIGIERDVGKCGPLSGVYNSSTNAACKNIMFPFNGYWASVGWVFIFFLPCMALAVRLATLYRKTEAYSGTQTESHDSMYDAYAERDNIPLTSGYDKKGRRRSRDYDAHNVGSSHFPTTQSFQATHISHAPPRNDYPQQQQQHPPGDWSDYPPTGGPPRYTSQPSLSPEYERPPPYYYPGPGK